MPRPHAADWIGAIVLCGLFCAGQPVQAAPGWETRVTRISTDPNVGAWLARQYNALGNWCCNGADAHVFDGDYALHADGSVTLQMPDGPVTLPAWQVLPYSPTDPNPTGQPIWWYAGTMSTAAGSYCFAVGPLT